MQRTQGVFSENDVVLHLFYLFVLQKGLNNVHRYGFHHGAY